VSQSGDQLKSGQLGIPSVTASTVANIGPGIDFYFGFGVVAATAGVAAPLTILAATVAVALLAFTVAEFTRAEPSAGCAFGVIRVPEQARAPDSRPPDRLACGIPPVAHWFQAISVLRGR
jgi:amino acid transporter